MFLLGRLPLATIHTPRQGSLRSAPRTMSTGRHFRARMPADESTVCTCAHLRVHGSWKLAAEVRRDGACDPYDGAGAARRRGRLRAAAEVRARRFDRFTERNRTAMRIWSARGTRRCSRARRARCRLPNGCKACARRHGPHDARRELSAGGGWIGGAVRGRGESAAVSRRIFTVLQLRLHPEAAAQTSASLGEDPTKRFSVDLNYVTRRACGVSSIGKVRTPNRAVRDEHRHPFL